MTELEIEAFLTIVKTGSITAAAQQLYVTQPALSRRIRALEQELGYPLMIRSKGVRTVLLTPEGTAFISVAEKWKSVWREAQDIGKADRDRIFHIASVGSISTYLLPEVFRLFMAGNPECRLTFHQYHSAESYEHVGEGRVDLALISDQMFSRTVETVPLFKGEMQLVTSRKRQEPVHPSVLEPQKGIRLPWNPEYGIWHDYWFGAGAHARVCLDQMSLMEYFLEEKDSWVVAPAYIASILKQRSHLDVYSLQDGPPDIILYYLMKKNRRTEYADRFLDCLNRSLSAREGVKKLMGC